MSKFYITTTLPYVNSDPHVGFALELIQADVIARYHRLNGDEVVFNTGTDEHGLKIYRRALEEGKGPQAFVDEYAAKFRELIKVLNISITHFIRTSDPRHKAAAQEFWRRCGKNGAIYKATYRIKYCVGCELEKTDSELENGCCPLHPTFNLEEIEEENYFFKFANYQKSLLRLYESHPDFVLPAFRFSEIKSFVENGLKDFSISRLKDKLPWGVFVPDNSDHVMFVWFDALVSYISTLGWPEDAETFKEYWPGVQIAGKDNLRQQSAMWQAMLLAAGLPPSRQILIHGFITSEGRKMSKSLGNVVDPFEVVSRYGVDPVRYYLLREIPSTEDGDFSEARFRERYNADLANGLGNLVARVVTLALKTTVNSQQSTVKNEELKNTVDAVKKNYRHALEEFRFHEALEQVWRLIHAADKYINEERPWEKEKPEVVHDLLLIITEIATLLDPFLPETAEKIRARIFLRDGVFEIKKGGNLFPRI